MGHEHEPAGAPIDVKLRHVHHPTIATIRMLVLLLSCLVAASVFEFPWHARQQIGAIPRIPWATQSCRKDFADTSFDWYSLQSHKSLRWTSCYDGNKMCARFEVPLDYTDPKNGRIAVIALLKIPSRVESNSLEYGGPVLFNPGGPGGSGVDFINSLGYSFQEIIGYQYDIVGFDSRGVGHTTPAISVFGADRLERLRWDLQEQTYPLFNETEHAAQRIVSRYKLYNNLIDEHLHYESRFVSTAIVANDMLRITRAHGRDKLLYWGFSYGTVLGLTYASMYPNNVSRLVVDGNFDVNNYYKGLWSSNLRDTESVLAQAFKECAGNPSYCALYESTPEAVEARYRSILDSLRKNPVAARNGNHGSFINYRVVQWRLFDALARPYRDLKPIFEGLADLEKGDGRKFLSMIQRIEPKLECSCESSPEIVGEMLETQIATTCADAGPLNDDPLFLQTLYERMARDSTFADVWIEIPLGCVGWKIKPTLRFDGQIGGNTSYPILFIGNTGDPQTPLGAAHKMSPLFKDSVVLTQESIGHCSIAETSLCTHKAVRSYFQDGVLPPAGTRCSVIDSIFGFQDEKTSLQVLGDDLRLLQAARRLANEAVVVTPRTR